MLMAAFVVSLERPAIAFPAEWKCYFNRLDYRFVGNWTNAEKDAFRTGIQRWEEIRGLAGQQLIDVREVISGGVTVEFYSFTSNTLGDASCSSRRIRIKTGATLAQIRGVSSHEAGHMLGANHAGDDEQIAGAYGNRPRMSTGGGSTGCAIPAQQTPPDGGLTYDDWAWASWKYDIDTRNPVTANASFENLTSWWRTVNANLNVSSVGGGSNGVRYGSVDRLAGSGSIFSDTRIYDFTDNDPLYVQAASKDSVSNASGAVSITLHRRVVEVPPVTPCNEYPSNGYDYNQSSFQSDWMIVAYASCEPSSATTWSGCATGGYNHREIGINDNKAVDVRAQFNTSRNATVRVDYLRVALGREYS